MNGHLPGKQDWQLYRPNKKFGRQFNISYICRPFTPCNTLSGPYLLIIKNQNQ
jgi:hypothetical protein